MVAPLSGGHPSPLPKLLLVSLLLALTLDRATAGGNKIVCYYASWAHYRTGAAKYTVDDVPVEMCTHVIYAFAVLDSNSLTAVEHDSYLDKDDGFGNYRRFLQLRQRNPKAKYLLGLGGWTDSRSDKYSRMVSSPRSRTNFISHVVRFLKGYGFDGLDLDWEYPSYEGTTEDREGFRLWVEELKAAFVPHDLLLTAAVSAGKNVIDRGYDVPAVAKALDQIHVMAYDFHGSWERQVAHHAPLFSVPSQPKELSADFAINHWIKKGAEPMKLVLGVPFYGRSWTLAGESTAVGAAANGAGRPGPLLRDSGTLAYYELCQAYKQGWQKVSSPEGPHLISGDQWVGYDDTDTIIKKTQYAKSKGLGGIMIWDTAMDDFRDSCGNGPNPLLTTIYKTLGGSSTISATTLRPSTPVQPKPTRPIQPKPTKPTSLRPTQPIPEATTTNPMGQLDVEQCRRTGYTRDPESCSHFYRCVSNRAYHFQCPAGLYWNQERRSCDWRKAALCKRQPLLRNGNQSSPTRHSTNNAQGMIHDRTTGATGFFSHFL